MAKARRRPKRDSVKYMQVLNRGIYRKLRLRAKRRGIAVQELMRAVIIPEWLIETSVLKIRILALQHQLAQLRKRRRRKWSMAGTK